MSRARIRALTLTERHHQLDPMTLSFTHPATDETLDRVCFIGPNGTGKTTLLRMLLESATWEGEPSEAQRVVVEASPGYRLRQSRPRSTATLPDADLDRALAFQPRDVHKVSADTVSAMWQTLIYLVKRRDSDRSEFELKNQERTKAQLIAEFDAMNPPILERLAALWDKILAPAGLRFDVEHAKIPIQLRDNLEAFVVSRETGVQVPYDALSAGIRDFLFRVGHLFLLYAALPSRDTVVFVDEPETSLFPDLKMALMEIYESIFTLHHPPRTQAFFATHDPLVAAQFHPWERFELRWAEPGRVSVHRGVAPKGDDPNDLLRKDFGLPHLMGLAGREAWARYQVLRRALRAAEAPEEKLKLAEEAAEIATTYGFHPQDATP